MMASTCWSYFYVWVTHSKFNPSFTWKLLTYLKTTIFFTLKLLFSKQSFLSFFICSQSDIISGFFTILADFLWKALRTPFLKFTVLNTMRKLLNVRATYIETKKCQNSINVCWLADSMKIVQVRNLISSEKSERFDPKKCYLTESNL